MTAQSSGLWQGFLVCAANLAGMERSEAEAIYDSGREACVEFILELAGLAKQHEDRLRRLEEQAPHDSRTSSRPPSADRASRGRSGGGQPGHQGAGRDLKPEDQVDEIVDHYPEGMRRLRMSVR
ncbi:MAG: hypothetical protein JO342_09320 [Solirubrobacterales bacterium]|nr:hypothetical protein [Solirubrobacterales bacterium]MBV9166341.1 hypothetical protein [Solirubrobacterales bacterium]